MKYIILMLLMACHIPEEYDYYQSPPTTLQECEERCQDVGLQIQRYFIEIIDLETHFHCYCN